MRLAEDVKELGSIEQQPLLDGRNMVMVLAPNKNVGVKTDAKDEDSKGSEEALQDHRDGEAPPPPASSDHPSGAPDQEPSGEAEARAAARAGRV
jgi:translation initiation factor IF-3